MKKDRKQNIIKSLKLTLVVQLAWIAISAIYVLRDITIDSDLLAPNLLILFVPVIIELITKINIPIVLQIHFHIFMTTSSLMGSILEFYGSVNGWDTYVHMYSGVLIALIGLFIVREAEDEIAKQFPKWFTIVNAFIWPMALATLWEIYEYASDQLLGTNMQVGGLEDTIIDMLSAIVGAAIAMIIVILFKRPKSVLPRSLK